jgi:hypothetical protein
VERNGCIPKILLPRRLVIALSGIALALRRPYRSTIFSRLFISFLIGPAFFFSLVAITHPALAASGLPDWPEVIKSTHERLASVESDQAATELFISTVGPTLGLNDVAGTIAAKGLPSKLAKELAVSDITASARRLVAALAAWDLADNASQALRQPTTASAPNTSLSPAKLEWLRAAGNIPSLPEIASPPSDNTAAAIAAGRTSLEASQQVTKEWWYLKTWKDRVRLLRGQSRLCGTWQWAIHNHQQHHQEQKLSLIFPPPGNEGSGIKGLSEVVVLGDIVYLRWEIDGRTQEDSLLFTKEGQRLEGTFVNSQGGWGSVSGKRTASCTP